MTSVSSLTIRYLSDKWEKSGILFFNVSVKLRLSVSSLDKDYLIATNRLLLLDFSNEWFWEHYIWISKEEP